MKYKNIRSVAHNFGYSFLSDTNAAGEGSRYVIVPERLFETAARARIPEVRIDFLAGTIVPEEARIPELETSVRNYARWLPELLGLHNVSAESVVGATLTLTFDYTRVRRTRSHPVVESQEFSCRVEFVDDRGSTHVAHPDRWWME